MLALKACGLFMLLSKGYFNMVATKTPRRLPFWENSMRNIKITVLSRRMGNAWKKWTWLVELNIYFTYQSRLGQILLRPCRLSINNVIFGLPRVCRIHEDSKQLHYSLNVSLIHNNWWRGKKRVQELMSRFSTTYMAFSLIINIKIN